MQAEIGIIGGTGVYDPQLLKNLKEIKVHTPYGPPSDSITIGELKKRQIAFIPRHSKKHTVRPTDVNSRANIFALKELGVGRILAPSAVGSLNEEFKPGDVVFVDQFIDRTTKREQSFYMGLQVCHISVAEPIMTLVPECVLAREAEICYASIATVTDYDVWKDHPVSVEEVVTTMRDNVEKVKQTITEAVLRMPRERGCQCGDALKNALV